MSRFHSIALACALAVASLPASAASSASASISNIQFQLIDLTPTDGSVSGFSLANLPGTLSFNISDYSQSASESYNYSRNGLGTYTKTASGDLGTVSAGVSAGLNSLAAQGQAGGPGTSYSASVNGNGYYYSGNIRLSAQSVLIITADSLVMASATNPAACASYHYYCNASESASASTWLNLSYSLPTPAGSVSGSSNNGLSANASARGEYSYQSHQGYDFSKPDWYNYPIYSTILVPAVEQVLSDSRQFYAVFANTSNVEQTAYYSIGAQVSGFASTAPIPEPGTVALTLAGLAFVGGVARRRAA